MQARLLKFIDRLLGIELVHDDEGETPLSVRFHGSDKNTTAWHFCITVRSKDSDELH